MTDEARKIPKRGVETGEIITYHEILLALTQEHKIQDIFCRLTSVQVHVQLKIQRDLSFSLVHLAKKNQVFSQQTY